MDRLTDGHQTVTLRLLLDAAKRNDVVSSLWSVCVTVCMCVYGCVCACVWQRDLCSHRGLETGSDLQTFRVAVPRKLRYHYERFIVPAILMQAPNVTYLFPLSPRRHGHVKPV